MNMVFSISDRGMGSGNDPTIHTAPATFETFPFPEGLTPNIPAEDYASDPRAIRIAAAAKRLDDLRKAGSIRPT